MDVVFEAISGKREIARPGGDPLTEIDVRDLHSLVAKRSCPEIAGRYAVLAR